jgi:hypothetical protein
LKHQYHWGTVFGMAAGERDLTERARDVLAERLSDGYPGWFVGHDTYGWHGERLADGHVVRAAGPDGLRALMGAAPSVGAGQLTGEIRREYPGWHIWRDPSGWWHARRRGNFREEHEDGAPLYAVHEPDATLLRARLREQDPLAQGGS